MMREAMKLRRALLVGTVLLLQAVIACDALAQRKGGRSGGSGWSGRHGSHGGHKHHHGSFFIGAGFYAPWYSWWYSPYWYPLPYYPLAVPVQLEQYATPLESGYWYYCHSAGAYYPGVAECPEGWAQVAPAPADAEPR
jgi:hypothetical protein